MFQLEGKQIDSLDEFQEEYFREMARRLFGHTEHQPSYFFNNEIEDISELQAAISNKTVRLPALIVDAFDDALTTVSDRHRNEISFNITVVDYFKPGSPGDLKKARRKCRDAARKIVLKMLRDTYQKGESLLYSNHVFVANKNHIPGMYLGQIQGIYTGWTYEIDWFVPADLSEGLHDFGG